jgi:hypothetical protein
MKISEIADELAKLNEPEQDADDDEAEKAEFEKLLMEHPEITDEMALSAIREVAEAEVLDPVTAAARERCRQLGIGDFEPHKRNKIKPLVVPEETPDSEEPWLRQVLEKRRAMVAAQPQPPSPAPRVQQPQQSWIRPRRGGYYAALDD